MLLTSRSLQTSDARTNCPTLTMDELSEITQHLLRFSPDALIVIDDGNRIRFANETVRDVFGYGPEELLGNPLEKLIPERFRPHHGAHTSAFMNHPQKREMGARITDLFALRADGSEFAAGIRLAPFRIGGKLFVAAAIRDTTERRLVNEELLAARTEAERANRAKSRFLATASHDLRQPLQTVRLLNAALSKIVPDPQARELLLQQGQAIESMARLLNALLDISRLESGAIEPVESRVAVDSVFAELRTEFESLAAARNIDLIFRATKIVLSTDRTLFSQLLQNLIGNALKYTDRGWVRIVCAGENGGVVVSVEDSGIGIPGDKLERIFDEYYQVDTHGTKRMGVGLGLAIVKEVARLLGFSVRIRSIVGEGTQATIAIPARHLLASDDKPAVVPAVRVVAPPSSRKGRLILVEDNDAVRIATELFLKLEGYTLLTAGSFAEAQAVLEQIKEGDMVIADYHLDDRNTGLDLLMNLRKRCGFDIPAVILSGDLPSVQRSIKVPVLKSHFLSKPVDTTALLDAIHDLGNLNVADDAARK